MTLLTVTGLCKSFGGVVAAKDVSFTVAGGELGGKRDESLQHGDGPPVGFRWSW